MTSKPYNFFALHPPIAMRFLAVTVTLACLCWTPWAQSLDSSFELLEFSSEDCTEGTLLAQYTGVLPSQQPISPDTKSVFFAEGNVGLIEQLPGRMALTGDNGQTCLEILPGTTALEISVGDDVPADGDEAWDPDAPGMVMSEDELEAMLAEMGMEMHPGQFGMEHAGGDEGADEVGEGAEAEGQDSLEGTSPASGPDTSSAEREHAEL
jgi:hypothetical protein